MHEFLHVVFNVIEKRGPVFFAAGQCKKAQFPLAAPSGVSYHKDIVFSMNAEMLFSCELVFIETLISRQNQ